MTEEPSDLGARCGVPDPRGEIGAACQDPVEKVIPYLNQPEEVVPGIATHYHSVCRECPSSCGITVKTREGRPIKVEGQAGDPLCAGTTCVRGQASLGRTYDPARFHGPMRREGDALVPTTWEEAFALLIPKLQEGAGRVFFLGGLETGTLDKLIDRDTGDNTVEVTKS